MKNRYTTTLDVDTFADMSGIRCGQWVKNQANQRGQYLGTTSTGTAVIRWQNGKFEQRGDNRDTMSNYHLRKFAKLHGAK